MIDSTQWQRYVDNQCTPEEKKEIALWLSQVSSDELDTLVEAGWDRDAPPIPGEVDFRVRTALEKRMSARPRRLNARVHRMTAAPRRLDKRIWLAAACVVLLVCALALLRKAKRPEPLPLAYKEIRNTTGNLQITRLPDGSFVWLSPRSVLRMGSDFNTRDRHIQLSGEAYFEVEKDPSRPFMVSAGPLQTTVLGTHFDIESYPGESTTTVSLSEGAVTVSLSEGSAIRLSPGMRLSYKDGFATGRLLPGEENMWKNGSMVLNDVSMPDALHRIGARFGKTIRFSGAGLDKRRITATYVDPTLDVILRDLAYVQGFTYRRKGDTVFIQSR